MSDDSPPKVELPWRRFHCFKHGHEYQHSNYALRCGHCGKQRSVVPSPLVVVGVVIYAVLRIELQKAVEWIREKV